VMDIAGISSTKRLGSNTVELDDRYSCTSISSQQCLPRLGCGYVQSQLAGCVDEWIKAGWVGVHVEAETDRPPPVEDFSAHVGNDA